MLKPLLFNLLLILPISLSAVDFVLFTQPKTATHFLIPILTEFTHKNVYWAKEFTEKGEPLAGSLEEASSVPDRYLYSLNHAPWDKAMLDKVWQTSEQQGAFLHMHAPCTEAMEKYLAEKNCINFFVKRDPRDQIISLLNHYKNIHYNDPVAASLPDDEARIAYLIQKEARVHALFFLKWTRSAQCVSIDFAKLMGTHGGAATDKEALDELKKIAEALQLQPKRAELKRIYRKHFGKSWNFFKGKVGVWREYFTEEHKALTKASIGDLLIEYGFEQDSNW